MLSLASQAYILFRAELAAPFTFSAGMETLEVALFDPQSIPFDEVRRGGGGTCTHVCVCVCYYTGLLPVPRSLNLNP